MTTGKALNGKPYAGNPHVRFDEGEVAQAAKPRRGSLLYKKLMLLMVGVCTVLSAMCGMPVNPKLPMSFGVDSTGRNRFVGELKDIQLSFGGKMYHSGPAKAGDRVANFPTLADAKGAFRFTCRFVTKDAAKSQRLLDNVTPGKGDGFLIDVYQGKFRAVIGGICSWSHPVPIRTGRETTVEVVVSADDEVTVSVDGDAVEDSLPRAGRVEPKGLATPVALVRQRLLRSVRVRRHGRGAPPAHRAYVPHAAEVSQFQMGSGKPHRLGRPVRGVRAQGRDGLRTRDGP